MLTSSAGGEDDGVHFDGALITVGGIGDINNNPSNPNEPLPYLDDELYNILPISRPATVLNFLTFNESKDDNIFLAYFVLSGATIVDEEILLSQTTYSGYVGSTDHTVKAAVMNPNGQPIPNRLVTFTITSGPNSGKTFSTNTNSDGEAFYTFTGSGGIATNNIQACFTNSQSQSSCSNTLYFQWVALDYYSKPTGDLHNLLTWGINSDGTGANPTDFGVNKTFKLTNRVLNYTMTADWVVEGSIVIPSGAPLQLNGFTLSEAGLSGPGTITGSPASSLIVTGNIPHTLLFTFGNGDVNLRTLNNLTLNRTNTADVVKIQASLFIVGVLTVNTGTLMTTSFVRLASTAASGTARVAPVPGTGIISGYVTVERFIPARRAWRLLTSPIAEGFSINSTWQLFHTNFDEIQKPNPGSGTHITQSISKGRDGLDFNTATAMSSLKSYNNPTNTWVPVLNTKNAPANKAWFIFVRGDRTIDMGYNSVAPNNTVLSADGQLNIGDQTFPIAASGLNVIPNPYASPINFASIAANNPNISNSFTVVDPKLGSTGAFVNVSFNGVSYDVTPAAVSPINELIQSGQGFLVQSKGVAGNIVIRESDKSATPATNVFRVADNTSKPIVTDNTSAGLRINLQTTVSDTTQLLDEAYSSYNNNFSNNVDDMDVLKVTNPEENLGIVTQEQTMMVDRRKYVNASDVIQLKLWNTSECNYLLQFNPVNLNSLKVSAFLEDSYLKTSTLIDLNKGAKIPFNVSSDVASKNPYRFKIVFSNAKAPLESIFTSGKAEIQVVPNPVINKSLGIQLVNQPHGQYNIELIDNLGRVVYKAKVAHAGGTVKHTLLLENKVLKGLYNLKIFQGETIKTVKVLIQ